MPKRRRACFEPKRTRKSKSCRKDREQTGNFIMKTSAVFREEGNQWYRSSKEVTAPILKLSRLEKAIMYYNQALEHANTQEEESSAAKNLGVAYYNMCTLVHSREGLSDRASFLTLQAILFLSKAIKTGSEKPSTWINSLVLTLQEACGNALEYSSVLSFQERISFNSKCLEKVESGQIKAQIYVCQATVTFHEGIRCLEAGEAAKGLSLMKDCYHPIEEAKVCASLDKSIFTEIRVLEEDVKLNTWLCESLMARKRGEALLHQALKSEETLNMALVWQAIDHFKESILLSRESNTEMEAIAYSRIGRVYAKVLKLKSKASENYKRSLQLAMSMHPRTFDSEEWYRECNSVLEQNQKERVEQEDLKWQQERAKYVDELKDEIKKLKSKDAYLEHDDFLLYVYKFFPPKNPKHTLQDVPSDDTEEGRVAVKKILRNSCCHYHPDRIDVEKHGKKWKVMCEEIVKILTRRYEGTKGG